MPFDAYFLTAVVQELKPTLLGARIDKIQQPSRDTVLLQLRGREKLLLSANVNRPRIHLTQASFDNPAQPPMFCMLLRKHLSGGRIAEIRQPTAERVVSLAFDCTDEMGIPCRKELILELMGRNSNLILTGADGRILDCLRRVDFEMSETRQVLPGLFYHEPPKQDKRIPHETGEAALLALLQAETGPKRLDKWLIDTLQSEAPALTHEQQEELFRQVEEDYQHFVPLKADRMKSIRQDAYFNALQIKYAYAVTCHKAQGGQWAHVYVDQGYMTDDMLTPDYIHWLYTAFTRATDKLFLVNWPKEQTCEPTDL